MSILCDLFQTSLLFDAIAFLYVFIRAYLSSCSYAIYRLTKIMSFIFQPIHRKGTQAERICVCLPFLPYTHEIVYSSFSLRNTWHARLLSALWIQTYCLDYFDWSQIYLRASPLPAFSLFYQLPGHGAFEIGTIFTWAFRLFADLGLVYKGHSLKELYLSIML
jgi:hypothetical protein